MVHTIRVWYGLLYHTRMVNMRPLVYTVIKAIASYIGTIYILTLVRCLHGACENRDSRELARELEMMIARRVAT